jgi:hypothetical protein
MSTGIKGPFAPDRVRKCAIRNGRAAAACGRFRQPIDFYRDAIHCSLTYEPGRRLQRLAGRDC